MRGGRDTVAPRAEPALAFPVKQCDGTAMGGLFGDAREGGIRRHEGIDVFAARGTPAVAAADGVVVSAGTNALGGNVVWLRDSRRALTYNYAHLINRPSTPGSGSRLGKLSTASGTPATRRPPRTFISASTAAASGALDPRPFVAAGPRREAPPSTADAAALGRWRRVSSRSLTLVSAPDEKAPVAARLSRHAVMRVAAATGSWYRVELPSGETGYVSARGTEAAETPLRRFLRPSEIEVRERPDERVPVVESVAAGRELPVFGTSGAYLWVRTPARRRDWLRETDTR